MLDKIQTCFLLSSPPEGGWGVFDCHTHHPSREGERVILQDVNSIGVHPWEADKCTDEVINQLMHRLQHNDNKQIVAIGECGLDKLCTVPMEVQREVFIKHIELSEKFHLPLIIHCVKAMDELLAIRKAYYKDKNAAAVKTESCSSKTEKLQQENEKAAAGVPWIWHGFRGKPQQLEQLLRAGFYISFGFNYNKESLHACPLDRMLLETDDNPQPIRLLYEQVQDELGIDELSLSFPR